MSDRYVHGYSTAEATRLTRQANILSDFIHGQVQFAPGSRVIELGCGVGAQTVQLAARHPATRITAVDCSADSLAQAQELIWDQGLNNVEFQKCDAYALPFADREFDGAFVCFVLEHLAQPERALHELCRVLRPGARLHVFEGDHGATLASPDDVHIHRLVRAATRHQAAQGGNAEIGRALTPLLQASGFAQIETEPCVAYADLQRPRWVAEFTHHTFIDMMKSMREQLVTSGLIEAQHCELGIAALERAAAVGTFSYTFYRATAVRGEING
jgi:ubiquinone/menaquinone biosynthesis C-methylase UbiE